MTTKKLGKYVLILEEACASNNYKECRVISLLAWLIGLTHFWWPPGSEIICENLMLSNAKPAKDWIKLPIKKIIFSSGKILNTDGLVRSEQMLHTFILSIDRYGRVKKKLNDYIAGATDTSDGDIESGGEQKLNKPSRRSANATTKKVPKNRWVEKSN